MLLSAWCNQECKDCGWHWPFCVSDSLLPCVFDIEGFLFLGIVVWRRGTKNQHEHFQVAALFDEKMLTAFRNPHRHTSLTGDTTASFVTKHKCLQEVCVRDWPRRSPRQLCRAVPARPHRTAQRHSAKHFINTQLTLHDSLHRHRQHYRDRQHTYLPKMGSLILKSADGPIFTSQKIENEPR